jgi:hypothetical protein
MRGTQNIFGRKKSGGSNQKLAGFGRGDDC